MLVTSSSLTEDFYKAFFRKAAPQKELLLISRISVFVVAVVALLLSLNPQESILELVGHAWAGFGSAFGPLILLSLLWKNTSRNGAIAGMLVGGITVLLWVYLDHPYKEVYSMIPGFVLSFLAIIIISALGTGPGTEIKKEFDEVKQELKQTY